MVKFGGVSGDMLRQIITKIEKLEEEKTEVAECIRDAFSEAKAQGFDVKALRKLLKERKMEQSELMEQEEILDIYRHALGMAVEPSERTLDRTEPSQPNDEHSSDEENTPKVESSEESETETSEIENAA